MLAESMRSLPVAGAASVRLWAMLIVIAVPCLVHLPEFAGLISCNPLYLTSGLGIAPLHHVAGGSCVIDGNVGGTLQALGGLSASQWLHGVLPWWNPYAGAGLPLASEMQPASFFLPFVLLLHFTEGVLYLKLSMQVIAGLCALACFREIGASWFAAALGGVFFALNGSFAFFGDAPILPIAFLPLLVFGIERSRALAQSARPGGQVAVALGIAYSLVAGFPEVAFIDGLLALVWCAIRLVQIEPDSRWRFGGKVVLGGMIGLALATPAMVPFLDDLALSSIGPHGFVPLNHLDLTQLCVLLMPAIYGPPYRDWALSHWTDTGGYLGSALSLMAVFGVFGRRLVGIRLVCAGWILFWLAVFLGEPVTHCLWRITPPLNQVQVTRYAMPSIEFAACVLLVLGVDRWRAARRPKLAWLAGALLSVGTIIAVYLAYDRVMAQVRGGLSGALFAGLSSAWAVALVALGIWLLHGNATSRRMAMLAALLLVDACAQFMSPLLAGVHQPHVDLAAIGFLQQSAGLFRVYSIGEQIVPNYAGYFGVASIQEGYLPLAQRWADYVPRLDPRANEWYYFQSEPQSQALTLQAHRARFTQAGVRYIIVPAGADSIAPLHDPAFVPVFADFKSRIYDMLDAAPYFQSDDSKCRLAVLDRQHVHAICPGKTLLQRREMMFPGWHATVNGHKVPISIKDDVFQSIPLPAGESDIDWRYMPQHARLIALLFAVGLTGLGVVAARGRAWGR